MDSKIHQLLTKWPNGAVRAVTVLGREGYSPALLAQYRKSKWITSLGSGAVARTGDRIDFLGGIFALQHDLKLDVHVAERSALELQGRAHYVRFGRRTLYLVGSIVKLPRWFVNFNWEMDLVYRSSNLFEKDFNLGLIDYESQGFGVKISSPSRAMLEYLDVVPTRHSFEEAKLLMEGLVDLNPKHVQQLLEGARSIKAVRLFLLLAEECGHQWVGKVETSRVNLGEGKRNLYKGGVLHPKFQITVPADILSKEEA